MNIIFSILIFCIVLFIYLHVHFHLKTSDDLELYEIELPSKTKLEEICDIRQPVMFSFMNERILESCQQKTILDTYGAFDVKIRNIKDISDDSEMYIPLALSTALKVLNDDTNEKYISENNSDFLEETGLIKSFSYNDEFLRPPLVSNCIYDLTWAAEHCKTPFRYEVNYRNYFLVTEGEVKLKLAPPKSAKYLYVNKDYENFEFRSPINPWQVQVQYRPDFDKIKCLEVTVTKGKMLFIPAYWWYSMDFSLNTTVCSFKYRTYMNTVALFPQIFMRILQRQNVKRNIIEQVKEDIVINEATPINEEIKL
uniref:Cupin-like domain-containing protein n=1 Tax=viral metagenome TaxID=1070528 RepID=A0A6C0IJI1_9ZZZZ